MKKPGAVGNARAAAQAAHEPSYIGCPCWTCGGRRKRTLDRRCAECPPPARDPITARRQDATRLGKRTYEGSPCSRCHNTTRATNNCECVWCYRKGLAKSMRDASLDAAKVTYSAYRKCRTCGSRERWTYNRMCTQCRPVPRPTSKQNALLHEHTHYEGGPCKNCGNKIRYTCNDTCIVCAARKIRARDAVRVATLALEGFT
jgi:hypothetical protein